MLTPKELIFSSHHLRRCSSPTAFAPQGPDLVGLAHMESPLDLSIQCDHPKLEVKGGCQPQDLTKRNGGTSYTINLHVSFKTCLRPTVGSMNLIKIKNTAPFIPKGDPLPSPRFYGLVGSARAPKIDQILTQKPVPTPSEIWTLSGLTRSPTSA